MRAKGPYVNLSPADRDRAEALSKTAGWNYDCHHPGVTYCGGCSVKIDGEAMLADLRETGWDLVLRAAIWLPECEAGLHSQCPADEDHPCGCSCHEGDDA